MLNFNFIPNILGIDITDNNMQGEIIAKLIIFYIGAAAFIALCFIPPLTLFASVLIPMILIIIVIVNLMCFYKLLSKYIQNNVELPSI